MRPGSHRTRDLGRLYAQWLVYPIGSTPPRAERARTDEIEEPYRCGRAVALRLTRYRALVLGWWGAQGRDEWTALEAAVRAETMDVDVEEIARWR